MGIGARAGAHPNTNIGGQHLRDGRRGFVIEHNQQVFAKPAVQGGVYRANGHPIATHRCRIAPLVNHNAIGIDDIGAVIGGVAVVGDSAGG